MYLVHVYPYLSPEPLSYSLFCILYILTYHLVAVCLGNWSFVNNPLNQLASFRQLVQTLIDMVSNADKCSPASIIPQEEQ